MPKNHHLFSTTVLKIEMLVVTKFINLKVKRFHVYDKIYNVHTN